jgi:AcrR family transcriptional regulator
LCRLATLWDRWIGYNLDQEYDVEFEFWQRRSLIPYYAAMSTPPETKPTARREVRTPQQARSRRTRQRVLQAAIECYEECGYDETTTAMIAERAGVAVGTVYGYFKDKRDIVLELLETIVRDEADEVIEQLDPASWRGTDPRDRTRSLIDAIFHATRLRPGIQRILWERYFKDEAFREPFEALRGQIRQAIDAFIEGIRAEGLCRELVDQEAAAFVILNAVQWNATQTHLRGDPEEIDRVAQATTELITRYLFVEGKIKGGA